MSQFLPARTTLRISTRLLAAAALTLPAALAGAAPQPTAATDGVRFDNPASGVTNITAPDRAIIDYASFDVGAGETVNFIQPDAASRVLNRIHGSTPSQIDGTITANGIVYLVNPAGVTFGPDSVVDVAGLYAAAGSLSNDDFLNGIDRFGNINGDIAQHGTIRADTIAALLGRDVVNTGTISVPNGTAVLASGDQVLLGSPLGGVMVRVAATPRTGSGGVSQEGTVQAKQVSLVTGDLYSLAVTAGAPVTLAQADTDGDGDIDNDDLNTGRNNFTGPFPSGKVQAQGDTDGDGDVDNTDLQHMISLFTGPITSPPVTPPPGPPIAGPFNLDNNESVTRLPAVTSEINLSEADLNILRDQLGVLARAPLAQERIEKAQARALYDDVRARGDQAVNPDGSMTVANTRLDADVIRQALRLYRERLAAEGVAPAERVAQIRASVNQAYQSYAAANPADGYDARAFASYLGEQNPTLLSELGALDQLRRLANNMGLNELEKDNSERVIVERARPGDLTYEQMKATLEAAGGMSAVSSGPDAG